MSTLAAAAAAVVLGAAVARSGGGDGEGRGGAPALCERAAGGGITRALWVGAEGGVRWKAHSRSVPPEAEWGTGPRSGRPRRRWWGLPAPAVLVAAPAARRPRRPCTGRWPLAADVAAAAARVQRGGAGARASAGAGGGSAEPVAATVAATPAVASPAPAAARPRWVRPRRASRGAWAGPPPRQLRRWTGAAGRPAGQLATAAASGIAGGAATAVGG